MMPEKTMRSSAAGLPPAGFLRFPQRRKDAFRGGITRRTRSQSASETSHERAVRVLSVVGFMGHNDSICFGISSKGYGLICWGK